MVDQQRAAARSRKNRRQPLDLLLLPRPTLRSSAAQQHMLLLLVPLLFHRLLIPRRQLLQQLRHGSRVFLCPFPLLRDHSLTKEVFRRRNGDAELQTSSACRRSVSRHVGTLRPSSGQITTSEEARRPQEILTRHRQLVLLRRPLQERRRRSTRVSCSCASPLVR